VRPTLPELPAAELIRLALAAKSHAAQGQAQQHENVFEKETPFIKFWTNYSDFRVQVCILWVW